MTIDTPVAAAKPKKSVALSGVTAGNTALCTVGRTGNDLHYRGYDILDIAEPCEFEEIAYLLVHGKLPNARRARRATRRKLDALRGLPGRGAQRCSSSIPASAHPMDVMRTGVSALGCVLPEKDDHNAPGARDIADRLMASLGSMLLYWYHFSHDGTAHRRRDRRRLDRRAFPAPAARAPAAGDRGCGRCTPRSTCTPSTSSTPRRSPRASSPAPAPTCTRRSPARSARCAARSTAAPTKSRSRSSSATTTPDEAEADIRRRVADKEVIIGFGHPVYTIADPRNKVIKEVARELSRGRRRHEDVRHRRAPRDGDVATRRRCSRTSTGSPRSSIT